MVRVLVKIKFVTFKTGQGLDKQSNLHLARNSSVLQGNLKLQMLL